MSRSSENDGDRRKDRHRKAPTASSPPRRSDAVPEKRTVVTSSRSQARPAAGPIFDKNVKVTTAAAMRREENEAASRPLGQDFREFSTKCDQIRKLLAKMKQDEDQPNPELKCEVALLLTDLKQLNRADKFRTKWGRDSVNAVKCKVDSFYLKLQNLLYEVVFVQKEIKRSLDYKSKADDVDLEDLQSFLKDVSDNQCPSVASQGDKEEHHLTLARLEWELQQRIQLADVLSRHEVLNGENTENIRKKQELLARLRVSMSGVLESMAPIASDLLPDAVGAETTAVPVAEGTPVRVKEEAMETN